MRGADIGAVCTLGRWLGPWGDGKVPPAIRRATREVQVGAALMRVYAYESARSHAAYLVLPGIHFLGPDDPRLDRFCRILAAAGFLVIAPVIPAYADLAIELRAFEEGRAAWAVALEESRARGLGLPAVFSVSFGSALAFDLLADASPAPRAAMIFGGFAEFGPTARFCATGEIDFEGQALRLVSDPLNLPVVALHVLEHVEVEGDREALADAWRSMVHRTWGRMELKVPGARDPIAHDIARALPRGLAEPFLAGCGLTPGSLAWLTGGLARAVGQRSFVDPGERLRRVRAPVVLVHGRDDDVIPYVESVKLLRALPPAARPRLHLTGLYGHTGTARPPLGAMAREARTLVQMLLDLARAPTSRG